MMRRNRMPLLLLLGAALTLAASGLAEEPAGSNEKPAKKDAKSDAAAAQPDASTLIASNMPVFVPPNRGAPPMRLGGATRSARRPEHELPRMEALVPEEPGWTLEAQPALYWYLAEKTDVPLEFGVQRVDPLQQVVRKRLPAPKQAGIQRIDLADFGVTLEPGPIYFWFVKLVPDPNDPEQDKIVGGGIRRVTPDDALVAELSDRAASRPHVLAKAGLWYDAVDAYSQAIEARPADSSLREQRAKLLEQVDIELDATAR
jgi:hypothetical protein